MRIKLIDNEMIFVLKATKIVTIGKIYDVLYQNTNRYDTPHVVIIDNKGDETAIFDDEYEVVSDESK